VSHEIFSSGRQRIRHGIDWTVRTHPTVAAGIAGVAITVAGAYVALSTGNGSENVAAARPPAAVGSAPAAPPRADIARPPAHRSSPGEDRPSGPGSGPGSPPGAPRPPQADAAHAAPPPAGPSESHGGAGSGGSGGSSGGGSGSGGDGGSAPTPSDPPSTMPPSTSRPAQPPGADCILRIDLLGNVVKVCP
jgi:hypothetical protein